MKDADERGRVVAALNFWHKIEFFIPFDLESRLTGSGSGPAALRVFHPSLIQPPPELWNVKPPKGKELGGFFLYLACFDKREISRAGLALAATRAEISPYSELERTALEGLTCFARLKLTGEGVPVAETDSELFSVSTLPWALGQLQAGGLNSVLRMNFEDARERLLAELQQFFALRGNGSLSVEEIASLRGSLYRWAGFQPAGEPPLAVIEPFFRDVQADKESRDQATGSDADDDAEDEEPQVGILNSFFIDDIERALNACREEKEIPATLRNYLCPLPSNRRVDLESAEGLAAVMDGLHPRRTNYGRWPSDPARPMAAMQQYAINTAVSAPDDEPLFSVNGPPGTGKTTLLQDVIAELVVRRARVLAAMPNAKAAFASAHEPRQFQGIEKPIHMVRLRPELTGFEMVVASSNNRAVENISAEFLRTGSAVAEQWRTIRYLQPIARKVAGQKADGTMRRLSPGDEPWGLLACKLGRKQNRHRFKERFAFLPVKRQDGQLPLDAADVDAKNIYEWIDTYNGPSFEEASTKFRQAHERVERELNRLSEAAELWQRSLIGEDARELPDDLARAAAALEAAQKETKRLRRGGPGLWAILRGSAKATAYRERKREHERRLARLEKHVHVLEARRQLCEKFPELKLPRTPAELSGAEVQKNGLWHSNELAALRTELFALALEVHEAWLAEVGQKSNAGGAGFRGNIMAAAKLLSNKAPETEELARLAWQSLFLMVPVVSTTFASFGRQFAGLGAESLGWVFIDEAGQATPQSAVGALWRAKRALVVGDPRQIEPVFTLPSRFIAALASTAEETAAGGYSPHLTSVQRLADAANRHGSYFASEAGEPLWVGSPLRVHRRCVEPMFRWANQISYEGKMVFGRDEQWLPDAPPIAAPSAWIDLGGKAVHRQCVPEQTSLVVEAIRRLMMRDGVLPNLYVISPFRAVAGDIVRRLGEVTPPSSIATRKFNDWRRTRVGTVHTFQGKEEDTVILVLGTDSNLKGAALWAASEPNILNVTLTRAKRRFYVVGDRALWAPLGVFAETVAQLPPMAPERLLELSGNEMQVSGAWG